MQFLFPFFLWGLLGLSIPILIHLFHFRRFKKVYFSNVRLLQSIKEEKQNRSKVKKRIILMLRMLAFAALIFAFAQPFIPSGKLAVKGVKYISIYIDNSFSMQGVARDAPLFELAKSRARDIVLGFGREDKFYVISNASNSWNGKFLAREDALELMEEIQISPAVFSLQSILDKQKLALKNVKAQNGFIYHVSDFQRGISNYSLLQDSLYSLALIPIEAVEQNNISIDSVWFDSPVRLWKEKIPLIIQTRNRGAVNAENIRLSLQFDGQNRPLGTLNIASGESRLDTVFLNLDKIGWQQATVSITDYPIQFDDKYFVSFQVIPTIEVLVLSKEKPNDAFVAAFSGMSAFKISYQPSDKISYENWEKFDLIILDELSELSSGLASSLSTYLESRNNVLFFPNQNPQLADYNSFFQKLQISQVLNFNQSDREVGEIDLASFPFKEVYEVTKSAMKLPQTKGNFIFGNSSAFGEQKLLTYRDGSSYLSAFNINGGTFYRSSAPLNVEFNSLVNQSDIFIPLLYKLGIAGGGNQTISYIAGKEEQFNFAVKALSNDKVFKIKGANGEFIPAQRFLGQSLNISFNGQLKEAGHYQVLDDQNTVAYEFAFNFNRLESDLSYFSFQELNNKLGNYFKIYSPGEASILSSNVSEQNQGITLWRYFLIAALIFLLLETFILRWWK